MGCHSSSLTNKIKPKNRFTFGDPNDLDYFNIINMYKLCNKIDYVDMDTIIKNADRYKKIDLSDEPSSPSIIILSVKIKKKFLFLTTVWESHNGLPYNICSQEYHLTIQGSDNFIENIIQQIEQIESNLINII